jgi:hypothetical protein
MLRLFTEVELEVGDMTRLEIMEADVILDNSTPCCPLQVQYNMTSRKVVEAKFLRTAALFTRKIFFRSEVISLRINLTWKKACTRISTIFP